MQIMQDLFHTLRCRRQEAAQQQVLSMTKSPYMCISQQKESQHASRALEGCCGDTSDGDITVVHLHIVYALHLSSLHRQVTQSAHLLISQQKIYACQTVASHIAITIGRKQIEQGVTQLRLRTTNEQIDSSTADKVSRLTGQIIQMRFY